MCHMPYVNNYEEMIKKHSSSNIEITIINWDRQHIENVSENTYRNSTSTIKKNFFQYINYSKFVKEKIKNKKYDLIIIFGLQMLFFLKDLVKNSKDNNFILDIRDKNKIVYFMNLNKIFEFINQVVISSEAYKEWLPSRNYLINHNTKLGINNEFKILKKNEKDLNFDVIKILALGSLRDFNANNKLIESLEDDKKYQIHYYGDGPVIEKIRNVSTGFHNIFLFSRYEKKDEKKLARDASFINVLRYADSENNRTALPNRLYLAAELGIPLLCYEGTYLSKVIETYKLGLVLNENKDFKTQIEEYINSFDVKEFNKNREKFLLKISIDNNDFKNKIMYLINEEKRI